MSRQREVIVNDQCDLCAKPLRNHTKPGMIHVVACYKPDDGAMDEMLAAMAKRPHRVDSVRVTMKKPGKAP